MIHKVEDIIYLAAAIDYEGSVSILNKPRTQQMQVRLYVANTYKPFIDWLHSTFGAKVYEHKPPSERVAVRWDWVATGREAQAVLEITLPYMKIKHNQAELAIAFPILQSGYPGYKCPDTIAYVRKQLSDAVYSLNKKGAKS